MATYEEVKDIRNHPEKYLIDVRNINEVAETGAIPASIIIPLPELEAVLRGTADDFLKQFKRNKPTESSVIVFTCRSGRRAATAEDMAKKLGYKK